jgi:ligand-binding sensor domain-containing protein/DNA-binding CsgD family transcriptional regulator
MRLLLAFIFFPFTNYGQNTIGLPDVINYPKQVYAGGLQSWDIKQDKNNIIYIANNEGLLSYDGKYWNLFPLPNKTIVRSIAIGENNTIYAGGQDEMGYFSPAENGSLEYHSLVNLLQQKDRAFGDVWDIVVLNKEVFFRTNYKIFRFAGQSAAVYEAPQEWTYLGLCRDQLYAHDYKNGIMLLKNNLWIPAFTKNLLIPNDPVTGILPVHKDSILITTLKNGIYIGYKNELTKLSSSVINEIEKERIYAATIVNEDRVALATSNAGVFIIDLKGQLIQRFSGNEGLQNNNVLCIFLDKQSNLWLGLNNGIDFIAYNSAIKKIKPNKSDGSGYTLLVHNNTLYTGTSSGLFYVPLQPEKDLSFSKGSFSPVANATGQVWSLAEINGQVLLGHHEGAFIIKGTEAKALATNTGYWNFVPQSPVFPTAKTVSGNYLGISFLNYENNTFSIGESIPDFTETSRFVAIDKYNQIWVSHPYHGVYKISGSRETKDSIKLYTEMQGLPSTLNNHVFKIKNEVIVATEKGVFEYVPAKDNFEPSQFYKKILGNQSIRYLKEDTDGNIWFIHEKKLGVIDMGSKKTEVIYLPELNNKMLSGFEFIYPVNQNNIFVGGESGFFHIDFEKYKKTMPGLSVNIRAVRIADINDSLLYGGYLITTSDNQANEVQPVTSISKAWKSILFNFSSPLFSQQSTLEYSFRLNGFTSNWSEWNSKTEKEYSNLPAGTYSFEVKVRNNLGNESSVTSYSFKILPPWYQTYWAYLLYFVFTGIIIYLIIKWQQKKFEEQQVKYEEEQKKLQYLHQLELDKTANELVALRNEKLQAEVDFKNSELATSAMHLVQKSELLTSLKTELNQVMKAVDNENAVTELKKVVKTLHEDDKMDKDWEHFAQHFDKVHNDFVIKLKEKHPAVTGNEIKLCAYLRMNLSTKEIAQLMNISVRGVEISRYRLRKKLELSAKANLFKYLINIE